MFFFIPLGTNRPHWHFPYATYGLMLINLMVYIIQSTAPGTALGFVPLHPSLGTWLVSVFTHAGLLHLLGNMLFLWLFGTLAEDVLGIWLFLAFYFGGAAAATGLDWLVALFYSPANLGLVRVGASGAIAGIMGLSAACFARTKVRVWYFIFVMRVNAGTAEIGAPVFLGLWVTWEILQGLFWTSMESTLGLGSSVAHWAHVGGFALGLGGALALRLHKKVPRQDLIAGRRTITDSFEGHSQVGELEKLVRQSPEDALAWQALGRAQEIGGRKAKAGQAYEQALLLFLRQHNYPEAAKLYRLANSCLLLPSCPQRQKFELARALERVGYYSEAYQLFREVQVHCPQDPEAETALMRAGEIARVYLKDPMAARECFQALLQQYPESNLRFLAQEKLRQLECPG
jgi:membrane associated rhomboid family serine protease